MVKTRQEQDRDDARAMLAAAYVLGRRADQRGKRTLVTQVLIKVLQNLAEKWTP